jgi:hypothetical protein
MKRIYVAGAYSDDNVLNVLANIGRGEYYASQLFMSGFAPFTPWHDKDFVIKNWNKTFSVEMFYLYSLAWLQVSDGVFVVPNHAGLKNWEESQGTVREIEEAFTLNIPVFHDLISLYNYKWEKGDAR